MATKVFICNVYDGEFYLTKFNKKFCLERFENKKFHSRVIARKNIIFYLWEEETPLEFRVRFQYNKAFKFAEKYLSLVEC